MAIKKTTGKKSVTSGKKPKASKRPTARKSAARKSVAKKSAVKKTTVVSTPVISPPETTVEKKSESKSILWFTVGTLTIVIIGLWMYSLQFTLPKAGQSGSTFGEANPQVDEFVNTVQGDWSNFKDNVDTFENYIDTTMTNSADSSTSNSGKQAPDGVPSTEELNDLFSDLN